MYIHIHMYTDTFHLSIYSERMDGWMAGWMAGWLDGWMAGWMDGWMEMCMCVLNGCIGWVFLLDRVWVYSML